MKRSSVSQEVERGEMLRFLAEVFPDGATPRTLLHHLDFSGYTVDRDGMAFHIEYLHGKGYVELEHQEREAGHPPEIRLVKITPAGIDLLDRRKKSETGVRI